MIKFEKVVNVVYCYLEYGLIFGGGNDFYIFNGNLMVSNGVFIFNVGYICIFNNIYNMKGIDYNVFVNGNL